MFYVSTSKQQFYVDPYRVHSEAIHSKLEPKPETIL